MPEGWSWCRLGEICNFIGGGTPDKTNQNYWNGNIHWASVKDIKGDNLFSTEDKITELGLKESSANLAKIDDIILITRISPGKAIITKIETAINQDLKIVIPKIELEKYFLLYFFQTNESDFIENSSGTTVKGIKLEYLLSKFIPLPPLSEQKLIVEEIEKIFAQIDLLEQNKTDLQTAIKQAKSKILDLAIHGKLVPQDPSDEPASVLLEKIRAEKEEKIAKGDLKRDKNDSYIYKSTTDNCHYQKKADGTIVNIEDEIPFDLPEGWSWCRLGEICQILMGQSPAGDNVSENKDGIEFHQGKIYFTDKYLAHSNIKTSEITRISDKESLLLCVRAPVGVVNITDRKICIGRGLCSIKPIYNISIDFWFYWIINQKETLELQATGTTFKAVTVDTIKNLLIPLPPLAEQQRIVTKIEEVFTQLDSIKNEL